MKLFNYLFVLFLLVSLVPAWAQKATKPTVTGPKNTPGDKVELVSAGSLEGINKNGIEIRKFKGNVVFKQKDTYMYCDSANQYPLANNIEAFSHVRITQ